MTSDPKTPPTPAIAKNSAEALNRPEPSFGMTPYAEQLNGRFAMLGFVVLLILEFFTEQDLITWLGLR
jgi:hypothetical protein